MSTPAVVPVVVKQTFLQHLGSVLKKILYFGTEAASIAEPIVDIAFPTVAPLYNSVVALAIAEEAKVNTTLAQPISGQQKLASLVSTLVPDALAWATQNGIVWPEEEIVKWASAVVDTAHLIPGPTVAPAPAVTTVAS